jgi:hypothetical protein
MLDRELGACREHIEVVDEVAGAGFGAVICPSTECTVVCILFTFSSKLIMRFCISLISKAISEIVAESSWAIESESEPEVWETESCWFLVSLISHDSMSNTSVVCDTCSIFSVACIV